MTGPAETQAARTALAWQRTGLSVLPVAALLARAAAVEGQALLVLPAAVVAVAGLVVLGVLAPRRQRSTEVAAREHGDARSPRTTATATALVVLTAVCALGAAVLHR